MFKYGLDFLLPFMLHLMLVKSKELDCDDKIVKGLFRRFL